MLKATREAYELIEEKTSPWIAQSLLWVIVAAGFSVALIAIGQAVGYITRNVARVRLPNVPGNEAMISIGVTVVLLIGTVYWLMRRFRAWQSRFVRMLAEAIQSSFGTKLAQLEERVERLEKHTDIDGSREQLRISLTELQRRTTDHHS